MIPLIEYSPGEHRPSLANMPFMLDSVEHSDVEASWGEVFLLKGAEINEILLRMGKPAVYKETEVIPVITEQA